MLNIDIAKIWMSQRLLKRPEQIVGMIKAIDDGSLLPAITLNLTEDGEIQVEDGHHRLVAIWLSGRKRLKEHEYILLEKDQWRPRFGRIEALIKQVSIKTGAENLYPCGRG